MITCAITSRNIIIVDIYIYICVSVCKKIRMCIATGCFTELVPCMGVARICANTTDVLAYKHHITALFARLGVGTHISLCVITQT